MIIESARYPMDDWATARDPI